MNEVGIGTRVLNFLIDTIVIVLISYGLYKWYLFYVVYYDYKPYQYYLFFFGTIFIYNFVFEALLSRTPAKYLTMTKVRSVSGNKPVIHQVLFRSLLRLVIIDCLFIPFLNRPLHDALSKTRVVEI